MNSTKLLGAAVSFHSSLASGCPEPALSQPSEGILRCGCHVQWSDCLSSKSDTRRRLDTCAPSGMSSNRQRLPWASFLRTAGACRLANAIGVYLRRTSIVARASEASRRFRDCADRYNSPSAGASIWQRILRALDRKGIDVTLSQSEPPSSNGYQSYAKT